MIFFNTKYYRTAPIMNIGWWWWVGLVDHRGTWVTCQIHLGDGYVSSRSNKTKQI